MSSEELLLEELLLEEPAQLPIHTANATINLLLQYIRALSVNVNQAHLPKKINIIFDSGAVNGIIAIGAALYIHHLEQMDYFKIVNVSGCSIGSVIALWYICGCTEELYVFIEKLFVHYKHEKNFHIYEHIVKEVVAMLIKDDDMSKINGRLYINYYDTKKHQQKVVSQFKHRKHLVKCILRSSHIPFLTNGSYKYQGRYIDGIAPYIFTSDTNKTNKTKNLFIQLIRFTCPLQCLNVKSDKNIYTRLLRGVTEVHDFLTKEKSICPYSSCIDSICSKSICTYVDNYSYRIHIQLYIRKYFILFFIFLIDWVLNMKKNIPLELLTALENTGLYSKGISASKQFCYFIQNKLV